MTCPRPCPPSAVLLAVLAFASASAFADTTESPLASALKALSDGDYEKAIELAEAVPSNSENAPRARYLIGEAQLKLGRNESATESFRSVLEAKPKAVPALVGLGRALAAMGKRTEAVEQLEAALKIAPKDAGALRALGELQLREEANRTKALKLLKAARKAAPRDPQTARAVVEAYLLLDQDKKAESVARKQIKATPKHPMGHFLRGLVLERRKKDKDAIEAYEKALALDDTFLDAHKNLAILCITDNPTYQDRARTKKALEHFERYFALGGKDPALERSYRQIKSFLQGR